MSIDIQKSSLPPRDSDASLLHDAFHRFHEASERLQEKYALVLAESQALREKLRQKEEEAARSERLALLGQMAAALAHEIRNPLGALRLFSSLLREDLKARNMDEDLLNHIETGISSMDHVVSNILHFAKPSTRELSPLNLHSLLQDELELIHRRYAGVETQFDAFGSPFILGAEHALRQVVQNLLLNAAQAMNGVGKICVCCHEFPEERELVLRIQDYGPGISPELLETMFEPFITSKNDGTGLGLAIVRKILQDHGASIQASNDSGAVFEIRFPKTMTKSDERKIP
jgi:signal transduction histidine kinase